MVGHLTTPTMDFRAKIFQKKYFYLGENPGVVRLPLYDDVTTRQFPEKIWYSKVNKFIELAVQILFDMWYNI